MELVEAQMPGTGRAIGRASSAGYVGDLETARIPAQPLDAVASLAFAASRSNGLVTLRNTRVATCV